MEIIEALTRWTARGAFVLYVLALVVRMRVGRQPSADISRPHAGRQRAADPLLWTAACALMFAHVGFAFHGFHHWSHRAAYEDTARQTRELLGMNWGGGLYANYALVLVWVADVARRWCRDPAITIQTSALDWCIQVFLVHVVQCDGRIRPRLDSVGRMHWIRNPRASGAVISKKSKSRLADLERNFLSHGRTTLWVSGAALERGRRNDYMSVAIP